MFNQSRIGKYMRRSISLILVLSMVLLTGCGSKTYKAGKQLDIGVLLNGNSQEMQRMS